MPRLTLILLKKEGRKQVHGEELKTNELASLNHEDQTQWHIITSLEYTEGFSRQTFTQHLLCGEPALVILNKSL